VERVNREPREPEPVADVPAFLREEVAESLREHEAILQHGEMTIVREIAPSFVELLQAALR
jgi:hypothetical protein